MGMAAILVMYVHILYKWVLVTVPSMHREAQLLEQRYIVWTSVSATYLGSTE